MLINLRLQNKVIDLEVENGSSSPTVDPSVRVILVGHSMGGIVAAETYIAIASETPIPYAQTAATFPSTTTNTSSTSTSAPPSSNTKRSASPEHNFMFPYIQGILAFDTPYLGISPGVVANSAESQFQTVSGAYTALSSAASAIGLGSAASSSSPSRKPSDSSKRLVAGPESAKDALAASADAAAVPAWQKWGKYAMWTGAVGAVAAGGAAAYLNRETISSGWTWASSHLEFVGCLVRGEELKSRLGFLVTSHHERGLGFLDLYTTLGASGSKAGSTVAGGFVEIGAKDGNKRTFCNLPTREEWQRFFKPTVNDKAVDEVQAHMSMFLPRDNPGFYTLSDTAKQSIVGWVNRGWYDSAERKPNMKEEEKLEASTESLDGEEGVVV